MQRISVYCFFIVFVSFTLISCDPCDKLDCRPSNYVGQFRIVSKTDGEDLIFGSGTKYDVAKLKFFSLNGTDTTFFESKRIKYPGSGYDSVLYVRFYPEATTPVYLKLNDVDMDTLTVTYKTSQTKCCGKITEIAKFEYNNNVDLGSNKGIEEIEK